MTVGCRPGRFCPDDPITRGDAASMLWRLYGAPEAEGEPFADVYGSDPFAAAVAWLWHEGLVTGRTADSFAPTAPLTADEALALLVRLGGAAGLPAPAGLGDAPVDGAPATTGGVADVGLSPGRAEVADVGLSLGRAEFAAILHRWVEETAWNAGDAVREILHFRANMTANTPI